MITELMKRLRQQGVKLWLHEGALKFKSYQSAPIQPDDLAMLKQHKPSVIDWLQQDQKQEQQASSPRFFDYFPLSENQKSLWLVYQMDPQSAAYNLTYCVKLASHINLAQLEQAYQALLQRHAILRTAYRDVTGEPLQTIVSTDTLPGISTIHLDSNDPEHINTQAKQQADLPFDLTQGQVCRAQIMIAAAAANTGTSKAANTEANQKQHDHYFQLTLHHIAADFWSCEVVFAELLDIYATLSQGTVSRNDSQNAQQPEPQHDYFEWSVQQQQWLKADAANTTAQYWQSQLRDHPKVLDIPGDYPRPALQSFNGNMIKFALPPTLSNQIRACAKALGVTPFVVGLATWQVLLYRFSNQEQFTIGTPTSGRLEQEYQRTVGYLVNPIVLTCHCQPNQTFRELVEQVKMSSRQALEQQQFPLSKVMENLQSDSNAATPDEQGAQSSNNLRDPSRNPLFQHMFALTHLQTKLQSAHHTNAVAETILSEQRGAAVDSGLILLDDRQQFTGELRYNSDIYSQRSANTFIDSYQTLISAVCEETLASSETSQTLSELPIMSPKALQAVLAAGSPPPVAYPDQAGIHHLFEAQASQTPNAIALKAHDASSGLVSLSFAELNQRANQLAHYLLEVAQVQPEQCVGVYQSRSIDMIVSLLAVLKAGAAFVPLDPDLPSERLAYMCHDARIRCVVLSSSPVLDNNSHTANIIANLLPKNSTIVALNSNDSASKISNELSRYPDHNVDSQQYAFSPQQLAYVLYTSGSTGHPKGVMIEHQALVNQTHWINRAYPASETDKFLLKTPFNFDVSLSELFWPLSTGNTLFVTHADGHKDPLYLSQTIREQQISKTHFVPTLLASLLAHPEACDNLRHSSALTDVFCAGEALSAKLVNDFYHVCPNAQLHNLYGPTEATIFATGCAISAKPSETAAPQLPIGTPVQNLQTWVLDAHLQPVAPGMAGELYLSGIGLARGYLNLPEQNQQRFITVDASSAPQEITPALAGKRLYKTGDLVRWLPAQSGYTLQYLGRTDAQVKLRGLRIELGEIENALLAFEGVEQACVLVQNNEKLVACLGVAPSVVPRADEPGSVVPRADVPESGAQTTRFSEQQRSDTLNQLRQALSTQLPDYMLPSAWLVQSELPLLPSGKIDRNRLAEQVQSEHLISALKATYIAPVTDMEILVCDAWQTVLDLEKVGTSDNFFALGGNSLSATKAVAIIQEQIQISVPLKVWFENPQAGALAAALSTSFATSLTNLSDENQHEASQQNSVSDLDRMDSLLDELGV